MVTRGGDDDKVSAGSDGTASSTTTAAGDDSGDSGSSDISGEMPSPDVTLADDVVVVDSKRGAMFKGYSDDGSSLLIDASAPGIDQLDSGEILLLSGITVVRASQVDKSEDGVVVTGTPATLPEVIADGDLSWDDVAYDPDKVRVFVYDDGGGGAASSSGGSSGSGSGSTPDPSIDDAGGGIVDGLGGSVGAPRSGPITADPCGCGSTARAERVLAAVQDGLGPGRRVLLRPDPRSGRQWPSSGARRGRAPVISPGPSRSTSTSGA